MALLSSHDENDFRTLDLGQMYAGLISYEVLTGQKILNTNDAFSEVIVFNWSDGENTYKSYLGGNDLSYSGMVDDTDDNGGSIIAFAQTQLSDHNGEYFTNFHYDGLTLNSEDFYHTLQTSTALDEALLLKYELSGDDILDNSNVTSSWKSVEIDGFEGADTITGGAGGDVLDGGKGSDIINGGVGPDYISGGWSNDTINLVGTKQYSASYDAHNVSSSWQVGTNEKINLSGKIKLETVIDGGGDVDTVNLSEQGDAYFLHDSFSNFNQSVTLTTDRYTGSNNAQRILNIENINGLGGDDIIDLTSPDYSLAGQVITIDGGEGNDIIWGSNSIETILGGAGNDILFGGVGADTLTGGLGADTFELTVTSNSLSITDYSQSEGDIIKIYRRADGEEASAEATISAGILTFSGASINLGSSSLNSISDINLEYATIAANASGIYNQAPVITSQMSRVVTAATENSEYKYYFSATASDIDDTITYSSTDKPSWLNFDTSTGLLSGTPNTSAIGNHEVNLIATDTEGNQSTQAFTVSVRETDTAEVIPLNVEPHEQYWTIPGAVEIFDFDEDGIQDVLLAFTSYQNTMPRRELYPKNEIVILSYQQNEIKNIAPQIFDIVPEIRVSSHVIFEDLDLDGDLDFVMSEAGMDEPPWTGGDIIIAINEEVGYKNVAIPSEISGVRSYTIGANDLDSDGVIEILLSDSNGVVNNKYNGLLLNYLNSNEIDVENNPIGFFWRNTDANSFYTNDYNNDGIIDLLIGGHWNSPNYSIYFNGTNSDEVTLLPDGPYGWISWDDAKVEGSHIGTDVNTIAQADFDNDGDIDLVSFDEKVALNGLTDTVEVSFHYTQSSINILENDGSGSFTSISPKNFSSELGLHLYMNHEIFDVNNDGLLDIFAHYTDKVVGPEIRYTMILVNEGNLQFSKFDIDSYIGNYEGNGYVLPTGRFENAGAEVLVVKLSEDDSNWPEASINIVESYLSSIQISEDLSYIEFS